MKILIKIILFINLGIFAYGLYLQYYLKHDFYQKIMGIGVLIMVFILMPLFLYYRYKDKSIDDYKFKNFNDKP